MIEKGVTIEWIILDAMGVVYIIGDDTNDLLVPFVQSKNHIINREKIQQQYLQASLGKISSEDFWQAMNLKKWYPEIEREYLNSHVHIDKDARAFIELIRSKGYKVGMLSNDVAEWSSFLRRKYDIERYFDEVIVSSEAKVRKPDAEIFQVLLSKLKIDPKKCLFVDDRLRNLEGAFLLGLKTIYFDRENCFELNATKALYVDCVVTNFDEIIILLDDHFDIKKFDLLIKKSD